jgi:hypothetical protein
VVCQAERLLNSSAVGSVRPELVPIAADLLAGCDRATFKPELAAQARTPAPSNGAEGERREPRCASVILFQMAVIHELTLSEIHPDAETTAYGPLADFITIARSPLY